MGSSTNTRTVEKRLCSEPFTRTAHILDRPGPLVNNLSIIWAMLDCSMNCRVIGTGVEYLGRPTDLTAYGVDGARPVYSTSK